MKIGVTAAGGFLGKYVCRELLRQGHSVVGIDNRPVEGIQLIPGRSSDHDLTKAFAGCDVILHLEWSGSFRKAADHPLETQETNLRSLHHILNAAKQLGSRFVFSSTGIVYGGNLDRPTQEHEDIRPRSFYGLQKLTAEHTIRIASELSGFDAVCVRVFNLYGKGATDSAQIIPRLIAAYEADQPFRLTGDGLQQRDFLAVEDAAQALVHLCTLKGHRGDAFNLGSGVGTTMKGLAEEFYRIKGVEPKINWVPAVPGESRTLIADMSRTVSAINYSPQTTIRQGLARLLTDQSN